MIKGLITRTPSCFIYAALATSLVSSPAVAMDKTEVVGNLKWTYAVDKNSAMVKKVVSAQDGQMQGVVEVPASFNGGAYIVTGLGFQTFAHASFIQEVKLPETIQSIGQDCFRGCKRLTEVKLPPSVQTIHDSAFNGCAGLRSVTLNEGLVSIGGNAFRECGSLKAIVFPATVKEIGQRAFVGTPLETVDLPDGVKKLGNEAFAGCDILETVSIGKGLVALPFRAFANCGNLKSVTIKDGYLDAIGQDCFRGCKRLTEVKLPPSVKIDKSAFRGCPVTR